MNIRYLRHTKPHTFNGIRWFRHAYSKGYRQYVHTVGSSQSIYQSTLLVVSHMSTSWIALIEEGHLLLYNIWIQEVQSLYAPIFPSKRINNIIRLLCLQSSYRWLSQDFPQLAHQMKEYTLEMSTLAFKLRLNSKTTQPDRTNRHSLKSLLDLLKRIPVVHTTYSMEAKVLGLTFTVLI